MVNQENTPAGSYPELSQAAAAAIDFVNEQLGGLDGDRSSWRCATPLLGRGLDVVRAAVRRAGCPVVIGGIDVFGNAIDVLDDNAIPFVGGIPVSSQSVESPNSFQWSGGSWGATVAFAEYAVTELDAKKVAIVFGEFGSIAQSAEYGQKVLEDAGVETQLVPYPIMATDVSSPLQAAAAGEPGRHLHVGRRHGLQGRLRRDAERRGQRATVLRGRMVAPTDRGLGRRRGDRRRHLQRRGADLDRASRTPTAPYNAVVEQYGDGLDPIGAGTVSFRSFMNLYAVMRGLGAEGSTADAITDALSQPGRHAQLHGPPLHL